MEARRFGFDGELPPAFKFDPTDSDLVAHYLLPRALGLPSPHEHAIVDDDPGKHPPWELLRRHGHAGSDHAFFFAPPRDPVKKVRACRAVPPGEDGGAGGVWRGQKGQVESLFLHRCGGGGAGGEEAIEIKYKRFNLTYYRDGEEEKKTSGWVMHEYQIVEPALPPGAVLARVKITDAGKKDRRQQQRNDAAAAAGAQVFAPYQDQPGPSGGYHFVGDHATGHAAAMTSDGAGTSSSCAQAAGDQSDGGVVAMGEPTFSYTDLLNAGQGDYYHGDNTYFDTADMGNNFSQGAGAGYNNYGSSNASYQYYSGGELTT